MAASRYFQLQRCLCCCTLELLYSLLIISSQSVRRLDCSASFHGRAQLGEHGAACRAELSARSVHAGRWPHRGDAAEPGRPSGGGTERHHRAAPGSETLLPSLAKGWPRASSHLGLSVGADRARWGCLVCVFGWRVRTMNDNSCRAGIRYKHSGVRSPPLGHAVCRKGRSRQCQGRNHNYD